MPSPIGLLGSPGFVKLLSLSLALAGGPSATSWSPDSRWIAYTVVEPRTADAPPAGWFFQDDGKMIHADAGTNPSTSGTSGERKSIASKIWATQAAPPHASVLLEESDGPLGSPSWRPDASSRRAGC